MKKLRKYCHDCQYEFNKAVWGKGNIHAEVMVVGQNPGANEAEHNIPFHPDGQAGGRIRAGLKKAGFNISELFFDNVVKCYNVRNEKPDDEVCKQCKPYLDFVINKIKPKLIIALGACALKVFTRKAEIKNSRGQIYEYMGAKLIATYHPAARQPYQVDLMYEDLKFAYKVYLGEKIIPSVVTKPILIKSNKELNRIVTELTQRNEFLFFDLETTGLTYWDNGILSIQFTKKSGVGYIYPVYRLGINPTLIRLINKLISKNKLVGQNIKFDLRFLYQNGFDVFSLREFFDTLSMYYLTDENTSGSRDLDTLVSLFAPEMGFYWLPVEAYKKKMVEAPKDILINYGASDVDALARIFPKIVSKMRTEKVWPYFQKRMQRNLLVSLKMELRGIGINLSQVKNVQRKLKRAEDGFLNKIKLETGDDEFNPNSHLQVRKLLFDDLDLTEVKYTKKGAPSTDKEVLNALMDEHPVVSYISKYKRINKLLTKDIKALIEFSKTPDGRIHTNINDIGTITLRPSSSDPNIMNIPADGEIDLGDEKESISIRSLFVAKEGYTFIVADYSQIEIFILGVLCGEEKIIQNLYGGEGDAHHETAIAIYDEEYLKLKRISATDKFKKLDENDKKKIYIYNKLKKIRRDAKIVNFGLIYGSTDAGMARSLGIDVEKVSEIKDRIYSHYPKIPDFQTNLLKKVKKNGYVVTPFGYKRRFPDFNIKDFHQRNQVLNILPQHCAVEVTKDANYNIVHEFERRFANGKLTSRSLMEIPYPVNIVYDSLMVETPVELVEEVRDIMIEKMGKSIPELGNHKFLFEIGEGENWSIAERNAKKVKVRD